MKKLNRKEILEELTHLSDYYCEGCLIKKTLNKEKGKKHAQTFCIKQCTVGEKLQKYGELLITEPARNKQ